jgi:RHS repeat-associated protein
VRLVVNSSTGVVSQQIEYDEFGNVLSDTSPGFQPFGYAGGMYDRDTQLTLFGARNYDPSVGRWLSKDPILFGGQQANLYGYVNNDPINFIDPSGLKTFWGMGSVLQGAIAGAIAGGATGSIFPVLGTAAGAVGGGLIGGIGGAFGRGVGGNFQKGMDGLSGGILGGAAGALGGSFLGGTGTGFVGGLGGAAAGAAYCSDQVHPESNIDDLLNQFKGFGSN